MGKRDISYESWLQMRNGTETGNYLNLMYMLLQLAPPWFVISDHLFQSVRSIAMRSPSLLSQCLAGLLSHDRTAAHCVNIVPEREPHLPSPAVEIVPSKVHPFPLLPVHGKLQCRLLFSFLHSCWEDLDENEDHLLSIERWLIWLSLHWSVECASIQVCRWKYWIARNEYIQGACFFPRLLYVLQLTSLNEFLLIVHQGEGVWLLLFMLIVLWELLTG